MAEPLMAAREAGGERPAPRDERQEAATSGAAPVTSGKSRRPLLHAYAMIVPLLALVATVNILSTLYDLHRGGKTLPTWEPVSWEVTSVLAVLAAVLILPAAARLTPIGSGWPRLFVVNLAATLPFSAIHSSGMFGLRMLVYRIGGEHYRFVAADFLYEYRKDLLTYLVLYGVFWIAARTSAPQTPPESPQETAPAAAIFTIIDGARTHRAPLDEILSLRAAGNYVEFHLAGGDRPLMRGSLQEMQEKLAPHGFLRTHRSWVVNPRRVRQLTALGSGDFLLTLEGGGEAPLSRRFPDALAQLKKEEGATRAAPSLTSR